MIVHYCLFGSWCEIARPKLLRSDRFSDFRTSFDWFVDELRLINEF